MQRGETGQAGTACSNRGDERGRISGNLRVNKLRFGRRWRLNRDNRAMCSRFLSLNRRSLWSRSNMGPTTLCAKFERLYLSGIESYGSDIWHVMRPSSGLPSDVQVRPSAWIFASRAAGELVQRWTGCISVRRSATDLRLGMPWRVDHRSWAMEERVRCLKPLLPEGTAKKILIDFINK